MFFSVKNYQEGKIRHVMGAGQQAGLTLFLDADLVEYLAPLEPLTGICVSNIQTVISNSVK
jgi:hypothetical protein